MTDLVPKSSQSFECKLCDYSTSRNSQYVRHMTTAKHIKMTNDAQNVPISSSHICECGRSYKYRQGLFSHRKRCDTSSQATTDPSAVATDTQPLPPHYKTDIKKLCKNENCSPTQNDTTTEKCVLCDGYFADNGLNDIYFLEENGEAGTCSLCGKDENVCIMKCSGQCICVNACDADCDEDCDEDCDG